MNIKILGNRLLVETVEPAYSGSIYIPDTCRPKQRDAVVVALGTRVWFRARHDKEAKAKPAHDPASVKVGDRVLIGVEGWEVPLLIEGKQLRIVSALDVVAVLGRST